MNDDPRRVAQGSEGVVRLRRAGRAAREGARGRGSAQGRGGEGLASETVLVEERVATGAGPHAALDDGVADAVPRYDGGGSPSRGLRVPAEEPVRVRGLDPAAELVDPPEARVHVRIVANCLRDAGRFLCSLRRGLAHAAWWSGRRGSLARRRGSSVLRSRRCLGVGPFSRCPQEGSGADDGEEESGHEQGQSARAVCPRRWPLRLLLWRCESLDGCLRRAQHCRSRTCIILVLRRCHRVGSFGCSLLFRLSDRLYHRRF